MEDKQNIKRWTKEEKEQLRRAIDLHGHDYDELVKAVPTKTRQNIIARNFYIKNSIVKKQRDCV